MFKIIIAAAIAIVALAPVAEAGERRVQKVYNAGFNNHTVYKRKRVNVYNQRPAAGHYRPGKPNRYHRPKRNGNINANGNINNSFNNTYNYKYNNGYNDINPWAAAGIGFLGGALVGALAAEPGYAYAAPGYGVPVQGVNTVPGCYYAAFVDMYGRQYFQQICN